MIGITGGSGFIGTRLCRRLAAKGDDGFVILDKAPSRTFPDRVALADIRSADAVRSALPAVDTLVHLAAEHRDDVRPRSLYDEVNVEGTRNLCQVAREKQIERIVFTSSVAVYGFGPIGADESCTIAPFNDYGRTKYEAECVLREWQAEAPNRRSCVVIRPTVVFGEQNRGNVYNLLRQIAGGRFVMVGPGTNRKSMAYVENVAAFIEHATTMGPGVHVFNYVDKPDFTMNTLVSTIRRALGQSEEIGLRLPRRVGLAVGHGFDLVARLTGRRFAVSAVRVRKFCADSAYSTSISSTGFVPPVDLESAIERTIRHEFLEGHGDEELFFTE